MKRVGFISLGAVLLCAAACGDSEPERSNARLTDAEITVVRGATTTIRKTEVAYNGTSGRIQRIALTVNGVAAGSMESLYRGEQISTVAVIDADGDRGEITFEYDDRGRIESRQFVAPSAYTMLEELEYDDSRDGVPREVMTMMVPASGTTQTSYRRYEHDDSRRLTEITEIVGQDTTMVELRYDDAARLERATTYAGTSVVDTHSYEYDPEGRIESVSTTNNDRWDVEYDDAGLISEIRQLSPSSGETITIRYTYGDGGTSGIRFTPDLPNANQFDLRGATFATVDFLTLAPSGLSTTVPSPAGGGGDGGGGGAMCDGYTAQDACETCLYTSCCSQLTACADNPQCLDFNDCVASCTDTACYDSCGSTYPTGRYYYESYFDCYDAYCPSQCGT